MRAWVDRNPPPNHIGHTIDPLYCDLAPSGLLQRIQGNDFESADAFVAAYEAELDAIPLARFGSLIERARRDELVLVSANPLAARTLRRYLCDMAAMTAADEDRMEAAASRCAAVVDATYRATRLRGASHSKGVCASRAALRRMPA
ncbi:hypothetical protein GCM10028792_14010 [Salinisphaera aquimarina]